ncbi:MAG: DUF308 domain-containing protein [Christensenella sp.]|jgi:uncharacterized membrane protein HdeD (DUF308 family)|nr:DUF308 domain-containing protein [Christensenella sp.]
MNFLKDAKMCAITSAVLCIVLGLLFLLFPAVSAKLVCYILVGVFIIAGMRFLVLYFRSRLLSFFPTELLLGLLMLAIACVLLLEAEGIAALLPVILGAAIVVSSFIKLCHAFELKRAGWSGWVSVLVLSLIGLVFGVLMLINPFKVATTVMILIGAGLVYSGVTDLVAILFISQQIRRDMNAPGGPFAR